MQTGRNSANWRFRQIHSESIRELRSPASRVEGKWLLSIYHCESGALFNTSKRSANLVRAPRRSGYAELTQNVASDCWSFALS